MSKIDYDILGSCIGCGKSYSEHDFGSQGKAICGLLQSGEVILKRNPKTQVYEFWLEGERTKPDINIMSERIYFPWDTIAQTVKPPDRKEGLLHGMGAYDLSVSMKRQKSKKIGWKEGPKDKRRYPTCAFGYFMHKKRYCEIENRTVDFDTCNKNCPVHVELNSKGEYRLFTKERILCTIESSLLSDENSLFE